MHNYIHKKLVETISRLDALPADKEQYSRWITAEAHLAFLRENTRSDEVVVFANAEYTYIDSIIVPNKVLKRLSPEHLNQWQFRSYDSIASYVYGGGKKNVWIERGVSARFNGRQEATQLVFHRAFEGWDGAGRDYIEVNQEYTHITGIHWRPEKRAYCRFDERGDLEATVSVTTRDDKGNGMNLVTFRWNALETYLSAADAVLLRRFDFTLFRHGQFNGWPQDDHPEDIQEPNDLFYHRLILPGHAAYTAGRQIIRPRRQKRAIHEDIKNGGTRARDRKYAEFIAYDWRNIRIATISTAPGATANYFNAKDNTLPFELSPAFFRPEVLSKYKTDRDKYILGEREVTCRTAWHLKGIDVNEAGQVHAYICDLSRLPFEEQLHWVSFNEEPKASISRRAFINDFKGEFADFSEPPAKLLATIRRWHDKNVSWWTLRDERLLERVNTPLTSSRDEWGDAFMDVAKLVVEGFETKLIRDRLDDVQIAYSKEDQTIALLEKLFNKNAKKEDARKLSGLRTVQNLRSKAKGHASRSGAEQLAQDALQEHDTFANHFKHVCRLVVDDLKVVETLFS